MTVKTVRLNDQELKQLKELVDYRNMIQNYEIKYTESDIIRIALSYMYNMEIAENEWVGGYKNPNYN